MPSELVGIAIFVMVFLAISAAGMVLLLLPRGDDRRALARLRGLSTRDRDARKTQVAINLDAGVPQPLLPRLGALLIPKKEKLRSALKKRFVQAGYYKADVLGIFFAVQLFLMLGLAGAGLALWPLGLLSPLLGVTSALAGALAGILGPRLWLELQRRKRLALLRRALPDTLDMLVLCVEGGVSLIGALQRVTGELHLAHPALAAEMNIVQREVQLGMLPGDALKRMGERCGLEEVDNLASVVVQADRYGAGIVSALKLHAEGCRTERQQRAEELAQKAAVKILFPTLLCIFPAVFIVLLGPAAFQLAAIFVKPR